MDYLASNAELRNRQLDSGAQLPKDDAFDDWLTGYLAEVLPAEQQQPQMPAQMPLVPVMPQQRFPWEDTAAAPDPGHDIGSSASGEAHNDQAQLHVQGSDQHDPEDSRATNRAARIADKNRCALTWALQYNKPTSCSIMYPSCRAVLCNSACQNSHVGSFYVQASAEALQRKGKAKKGNLRDTGMCFSNPCMQPW